MGFAEYANYDAVGLAELVANKDVTPLELLDEAISRIETQDSIFRRSLPRKPIRWYLGKCFGSKSINSHDRFSRRLPVTGFASCRRQISRRPNSISTTGSREALSKARDLIDSAKKAIDDRDQSRLNEAIETLKRTQKMFKGVLARS